jgi:hypothetical protein
LGNAIYNSTDEGKLWQQLSLGLPNSTGKIGLVNIAKNPKVEMALVNIKETDDLSIPGSGVYEIAYPALLGRIGG